MIENTLIVGIDDTLPFGVGINAAAHAALGLAHTVRSTLESNGLVSRRIVYGKGEALRSLRTESIRRGYSLVDFTDTMTGDTFREQLERTAATAEEGLRYYAVAVLCPHADTDVILNSMKGK